MLPAAIAGAAEPALPSQRQMPKKTDDDVKR
jgi:hypothetical protein